MIDKINDDSIVSIEYSDNVFDGTKVVGTFYKNVGSLEVFNYDDEYTNLVGDEIINDLLKENNKYKKLYFAERKKNGKIK